MEISNKDYRFLNVASNKALESNMVMKHGCVITCNNKFIASGYNTNRTRFKMELNNNYSCSCHAEMDALRKVIKIKGNISIEHRKHRSNYRQNSINNGRYFYREKKCLKEG
jgi:deoxycytidylate deaminase